MEQIKIRRHLNEGHEQVERYRISHDYRSLIYRYFYYHTYIHTRLADI